jgi:hypothetical protein
LEEFDPFKPPFPAKTKAKKFKNSMANLISFATFAHPQMDGSMPNEAVIEKEAIKPACSL